MTKRVLVPLADGFEEIEAITVIDILRRAGAEVVVAGLKDGPCTGRSSITVVPEITLDEAIAGEPFDAIALPGGLPGTTYLRDDKRVIAALQAAAERGAYTAAICAAPLVLDRAGLLDDSRLTSHPTVRDSLPQQDYDESRVVISGEVITSRSAGTAMEFAFSLVRELFGQAKVDEVNEGVLANL